MFPKSPDYKYVPYVIHERRTSSRLANNNLGTMPPLILGFHPSKRHAALITSCDQGSIVLIFILVLLVLKRFFMASNASYPDVCNMASSRSIVLYCLSSTNIMLFFVQSRFNLMLVLVA